MEQHDSFNQWMNRLYEIARQENWAGRSQHKGILFENFMVAYFKADPTYADKLENVWRYPDWPDRPVEWNADNLGFDLIAKTNEGGYWAIQCKFYGEHSDVPKVAMTNFISDSSRSFWIDGQEKRFEALLFVITQNDLNPQAREAIQGHENLHLMPLRELETAPIDWSVFAWESPNIIQRTPKKVPRSHQIEAMDAVIKGLENADRGKLIMACGTGKTFTSLKIMESMVPESGLVLFLAPSITLVAQTLREWCNDGSAPFEAFVVCSDAGAGKGAKQGDDAEDMKTYEVAYPVTTDEEKLVQSIQASQGKYPNRRCVIFSTYQSIEVVIAAQQKGNLPAFDMVFCDEAHRTTGFTEQNKKDNESNFVKVHQNDLVHARKRVYMTATPRIYTEKSRKKASDTEVAMYSMDDEKIYGEELFNLSFGEAASRGILSEYKVIIVAVDESAMAKIANDYNKAYKLDDQHGITMEFATRIVGAWKGLSNRDVQIVDGSDTSESATEASMRRTIGFCRSIDASKQVRDAFPKVVKIALTPNRQEGEAATDPVLNVQIKHVDGKTPMRERLNDLNWLKEDDSAHHVKNPVCRMLTNARCLSEGVDVPALDSVVFFDARDSMVEIIQAVGRVMRKAPGSGKEYGYVILPVAIPSMSVDQYDSYIDKDPRFKTIWKVLKAMRAHDERLVDETALKKHVEVVYDPDKPDTPEDGGTTGTLDLLPVINLKKALYAVTPKHMGDGEYWASWAKDVAKISHTVIQRIESLIEKREGRTAFNAFIKGIRKNLNRGTSEKEAIEMLAQHVLTRPIFDALFGEQSFSAENPVSQSMQRILAVIDKHDVNTETEKLDRFYTDVAKRVSLAKSDASKQDLIRNLYDTFFQAAFPDLVKRLGIVYTPVDVVDFILHSVNDVLKDHFDGDLTSEGVQILDPFTGTGTFITRLIQSDLIRPHALQRKYEKEIHANEIVLMAYYIAALNIETAYHAKTTQHKPFNGIVLADTFQMNEPSEKETKDSLGVMDEVYLKGNSERAERQKKLDIRVIVGNPPYSSGQKSQNDNNQNEVYPLLNRRIQDTYAAFSTANNKNSLYDSYVKAIRWASDRIGDQGVLGFITNGSFLDSNAMDGLRKGLMADFSKLYVLNLRGAIRGLSGDQAKKEGKNVFDIMTGVAITIMIKDPQHTGPAELYYHDIGDYLGRKDKLNILSKAISIKGLAWNRVHPNEAGDWISFRNDEFEKFMLLGDKADQAEAIFRIYSRGLETCRDAWVYNHSRQNLSDNMQDMIDVFNEDSKRYEKACDGLPKSVWPKVENIICDDPEKISWSSSLIQEVIRGKSHEFSNEKIRKAMYRPFCNQLVYFDAMMNHRTGQLPHIFPTERQENVVISVDGIGAKKGFSCLASKMIPDLHLQDSGTQCFPLYWYETVEEARKRLNKTNASQGDLFDESDDLEGTPDADGYIRRDAITDWALAEFRKHYEDEGIEKIDLFHYVYGLLHSTEYRETYAADLSKMLPRIPYAPEFRAFAEAGKKLMDLHLSYEEIEPWPLEEVWSGDKRDYAVDKIKFVKKGERGSIAYNHHLTLKGIPEEAYAYVVNGKSPVEWVMERYSVRTDKDSGIENDPNRMLAEIGTERYIVELIGRVVRVSVETQEIVGGLMPIKGLK